MLPLFASIGALGVVLLVVMGLAVQLVWIGLAAWVVKWVWVSRDPDELGRLRRLVMAMYEQQEKTVGHRFASGEAAAVQDDEIKEY